MRPNLSALSRQSPEVRIAAVWLQAQERMSRPCRRMHSLADIVSADAGQTITQADLQTAARLLRLPGVYPWFYIDARLTRPTREALQAAPQPVRPRRKAQPARLRRLRK